MKVFSRFRRPSPASSPAASLPAEALPVLDGETLLRAPLCRRRVSDLAQRVGFPPPHWEQLVMGLLRRYAEFVQQRPDTIVPSLPSPAPTRLEVSLHRTLEALNRRRGRRLPPGVGPEAMARGADRWSYGVLSAALLFDLRAQLLDVEIELLDTHGRSLGRWEPLRGAMTGVAGCAGFRLGTRVVDLPPCGWAALCAPRIMPAAGIAWLAGDTRLLTQWLACLSGQREATGVLGEIILPAPGPVPTTPDPAAGSVSATGSSVLPPVASEPPSSPADPFEGWLTSALRDGSLPVNQPESAVHGLEDGRLLIVAPTAFQRFASRASEPTDGDTVQQRFQRRRLHQKTAGGAHRHRYQLPDGIPVSGYVVPASNLHLDENTVPVGALRGPLP